MSPTFRPYAPIFFALVASTLTPSATFGQGGGRDDEMRVEGLLGTIPRAAARAAVATKQSRFLACFSSRSASFDLLAGRIDLVFRVATDGSVRYVRVAHSTVGDRATERCIRDEAKTVRFPAPDGGEAEVTDSLDVPVSPDVRPARAWPLDRVSGVVRALATAKRTCRAGDRPLEVTVYVGPGAEVLSGGIATSDDVADGPLDCVLSRVRAARFPDPGSYAAKVGFTL